MTVCFLTILILSLASEFSHELDSTNIGVSIDEWVPSISVWTLHIQFQTHGSDDCKIALSIEGGDMRGCVSIGMVIALDHMNLRDSFDVVYGSSAGTIIGSYFLTNELPWFGPEIY